MINELQTEHSATDTWVGEHNVLPYTPETNHSSMLAEPARGARTVLFCQCQAP